MDSIFKNLEPVIAFLALLVTVAATLFSASSLFTLRKKTTTKSLEDGESSLGVERAGLETEIAEIKRRLSEPQASHDDSAYKQYLLLREYHAQGLAQSKISFWFSLVFASLGFLVIVSGIFTLDQQARLTEQGRTLITLLAGTIIDAVAALFFVQSNKARQLMVDFFDRLRSDRKLDESLKLAAAIPDPTLRSRLHTVIALNFADIKSTDNFLVSVLNMGNHPSGIEKSPLDNPVENKTINQNDNAN